MTVAFVLAVLTACAVSLPHGLRLDRVAPSAAVTIWLSSLALRALSAVFVAIALVFYVPQTELFSLLTHWCWHAVLPLLAAHLGFSGHQLGDAATIAPAFGLLVSLASVVWALWRAARAIAGTLRRASLGPGPADSLIIGGGEVVVAAAGLGRPRVVVSAGALARLDDAELAASLDHERGHIARRHRFVLAGGEICRALGRFFPGTRRAAIELAFHLERDADEYALARDHDPMALASAICKAAGVRPQGGALLALGGGQRVPVRLRLLLDGSRPRARLTSRFAGLTAIAMVALTISLATTVPATAVAGARQLSVQTISHPCPG